MSAISRIEWTDRSWNPTRGCSIVSPGCVNCYAMKQAHRFSGPGKPYAGLTKLTSQGPQWTGVVRTVEDALLEPLSWRKPQRVFVNSMSDLFHEDVPDQFIDRVFAVMALAHRHTFQVLTKRADRMRAYVDRLADSTIEPGFADWPKILDDQMPWLTGEVGAGRMQDICEVPDVSSAWPLPNLWLGVSAENQEQADTRIPDLLQTPAAVRFVSAEPLLGPIRFKQQNPDGFWPPNAPQPDLAWLRHKDWPDDFQYCTTGLNWVIVGGESGHGARPCDVAWVRSIVEQCQAARVPAFVKQFGANVRDRNDAGFTGDFDGSATCWPEQHLIDDRIEHDLDGTRDGYQGAPVRIHLRDRKGATPREWPEDLRVREFPA